MIARHYAMFATVGALLLGASCRVRPPMFAPEHAFISISGIVYRESTMTPLANVLIRVSTSPVREVGTDSAGRYRLDSLPRRRYTVSALQYGFMREHRDVEPGCIPGISTEDGVVLSRTVCTDPEERLNFYLRPMPRHGEGP